MTWHLLGFHHTEDTLGLDLALPTVVDDDFVRSLIGDPPNLRAASFPMDAGKLAALIDRSGVDVNDYSLDYFIEFIAE